MTMVSLILIPIIFGVILYKIPMKIGKGLLLFVQAYLGATALSLFNQSVANGSVYEVLGGENHILFVALRGDRLALAFVGLAIFLFTMAFLYSFKDEFFNNKFMLLFLVLQGLLIGIFLTDDFFNLFILLEVATVVITTLIMFKKRGRMIYDGLYYLIIQIISMMFFLFGLAYIYKIFGVLSIQEVSNLMSPDIPVDTLILPFAFMITGIALKIGFFPLFSWVSRSYGTPSAPFAVIAILSGLFVKNNLYLFVRLNELFYPVIDYSRFFLILALLSGVIGAMKALSQRNIKLILAYSTVSQVGLITAGVFLQNETSYWGSMYHIINHAIFKTLLFFTAGILVETYGTTNIYKIRGVFKRMPVVAIATIIGILGITGAPFLNGSLSKYWILAGSTSPLIEASMWVINTGTILVFIKFSTILFGKSEERTTVNGLKIFTISCLSLVTILGGIFGSQFVTLLFGVELPIDRMDFLVKGLIYVLLVLGSYIFYRFILSKTKILYRYWEGSLTLPRSCLVLLTFFITIILYGMLFN